MSIRRALPSLAAAALLAGCQEPGPAPAPVASGTENASPALEETGVPTAAPSAVATGPDEAADKTAITDDIARVMASYRRDKPVDFAYSAAFDRIWQRAVGKNQGLDYDPICGCQDYDPKKFAHRMKSVTIDGDKAVARYEVNAGFDEWTAFRLTFVREGGAWKLDDIGNPDQPSLKSDMAKAPPGSFGIGE